MKPDLEHLINSNIDHRHTPVFLFYFKRPPRSLIRGEKMATKLNSNNNHGDNRERARARASKSLGRNKKRGGSGCGSVYSIIV